MCKQIAFEFKSACKLIGQIWTCTSVYKDPSVIRWLGVVESFSKSRLATGWSTFRWLCLLKLHRLLLEAAFMAVRDKTADLERFTSYGGGCF